MDVFCLFVTSINHVRNSTHIHLHTSPDHRIKLAVSYMTLRGWRLTLCLVIQPPLLVIPSIIICLYNTKFASYQVYYSHCTLKDEYINLKWQMLIKAWQHSIYIVFGHHHPWRRFKWWSKAREELPISSLSHNGMVKLHICNIYVIYVHKIFEQGSWTCDL